MAITVTPLSRRPWWLWLLPLLPGLGLWQLLAGTQHDTKLPVVRQWGMGAWLLFGLGALLWQAATMPITDYDANYLYPFTKAGTEQIPLASFYKLQEGNRGYWSLYYYGEQRHKKSYLYALLADKILPVFTASYMLSGSIIHSWR